MAEQKDLKLNYYFQILVSFWLIAALSFSTAQSMVTGKVVYTEKTVQSVYIPPPENKTPPFKTAEIDIIQFLVSFFFATLLMLAFIKLFKGKFLFEIFFSGAIIFGSQGPLGLFMDKIDAFLASLAIVILRFFHSRIWTQNLAIIIGISGISASLGMSVKPLMAASILIILSIYDIVAVYKTRHMVTLFRGMAERGAILALVVPKNFTVWRDKFTSINRENLNDFMFLGTGDLALPTFFAVSALSLDRIFFFAIVFGATLGIFFDHLYFTLQKERKPIPALPFITFFSIAGFVLAYVVKEII